MIPTLHPSSKVLTRIAAAGLLGVVLVGCSSDPAPEVVRTSDPTAPPTPATTAPAPAASDSPAPPSPEPGAEATPDPPAGAGLEEPVTVSGVTVRLTDLRSTTVGDAPAVSLTVTARNTRSEGVSLGGAQVRLEGTGGPVEPDPSSTPVPAAVGAGQTIEGTYVFLLAADSRDQVTVTVSTNASGPLVFSGAAPAA